jgi:5-methylcytosine-specific restriction endonuclease McrA
LTRELPEWIGATDDTPIPPRVKVRVFKEAKGCCEICTLQIYGKLRPEYDHRIALANGGANRETNLQLLCVPCHAIKTGADVKEKATVYRKTAKHLGIKLKKGRPFPGARNSPWKKKIGGGMVRR